MHQEGCRVCLGLSKNRAHIHIKRTVSILGDPDLSIRKMKTSASMESNHMLFNRTTIKQSSSYGPVMKTTASKVITTTTKQGSGQILSFERHTDTNKSNLE
jgi:hypothetical protein